MARSLSTKLRGLVVAFVAFVAALAIAPGAALADYTTQKGNITISGVESGDTVSLYKVVDYTYDETSNTVSWDFTRTNFLINKADYAAATDAAAYANTMATVILGDKNVVASHSIDASGTSVVFNGVEDGEYLVIVTPGANSTRIYQYSIVKLEPTIDEGNWSLTNQSVDMKSVPEPPITKKTDKDSSSYNEGDTVSFTIESVVPTYPDAAVNTHFVISDSMTNLTLDTDNISVKITGLDTGDETLTQGTDYTMNSNVNSFSLVFKYDQIKQYAGLDIVVTYTATIGEDSIATNGAKVEFARNPNVENAFDTNEDKVTLYTYTVQVIKTDADSHDLLQGAKFGLYSDAGANTPVKDANGNELTLTTDATGIGQIDGLAAGTYYLKEIKAPSGYQLSDQIITVTITAVEDGSNITADNLVYNCDITNTKTFQLPVTGGMGTIAFTAAGVVIMAGAVAFIARARKEQ